MPDPHEKSQPSAQPEPSLEDVLRHAVQGKQSSETDVSQGHPAEEDFSEQEITPEAFQIIQQKYDKLISEKELLQEEVHDLQQKILRVRADCDNTLRRYADENEKNKKFAIEKLLLALVPVIDSLSQGLQQNQASAEDLLIGLQLTMRVLTEALIPFGVYVIEPIEKQDLFDPSFHEAIAVEETAAYSDQIIMAVVQKGLLLYDRVIQPARVIVAKQRIVEEESPQKNEAHS